MVLYLFSFLIYASATAEPAHEDDGILQGLRVVTSKKVLGVVVALFSYPAMLLLAVVVVLVVGEMVAAPLLLVNLELGMKNASG